MVVISTGYNLTEEQLLRCCASVYYQDHPYVSHVVFDDGPEARDLPKRHHTLVSPGAGSQVENIAREVRQLEPDSIVAIVDGDDALAHTGALSRVEQVYRETGCWMTWGQFRWMPDGRRGFATPWPVISQFVPDTSTTSRLGQVYASPRWRWFATHLRTFRAGLFQWIPDEYLRGPEGGYCLRATDLAMTLPMLEMAGPRRAQFIPDVLYHYWKDKTQAHRDDALEESRATVAWVNSRVPLEPLEERPW